MPVSRKTEIQATKKVMAVIGVFFCCNICMAITGTITQNISITSNSRVILADITDVLLVLHCCLNVIIYGIFDPKFRRIFLELFCSCSKTNKNELNLTTRSDIPQASVSDSHSRSTLPHKLSMKPQQTKGSLSKMAKNYNPVHFIQDLKSLYLNLSAVLTKI